MTGIMDVTNALFDSVNAASNIVKDYTTNTAKSSTQNKQIQLKYDITEQMNKIRQNSRSENWETDINTFFEGVKNNMTNPDSPYYCKNNLQADMFNQVLDEAQYEVSTKVNQMVYEADREKRLLDTQHSCDLVRQMSSGQESLDQQAALWKAEYENRDISRTDYENQKKLAYLTEHRSMYIKTAQNSMDNAIKQNKTPEQFYEDVKGVMPKLRLTNADGLEIATDMSNTDEQIKKEIYSMYKAAQQDAWQKTETELSKLWDNVQDQKTAEGRNVIKQQGRLRLDQLKDTGYISSDQLVKWTNWFKLEDYMDGVGSKSSGQSAMNALKPEDKVKFVMNAIKRGDPHSVYSSYDYFQTSCMEELEKLNPELSYTDLEKACPSIMEFFEEAKKHLPDEMQSSVEYAKALVQTVGELHGDKSGDRKFYNKEISSVMRLIFDSLYEVDLNSFDTKQREDFNKRTTIAINSRYGNILAKHKDYKEMLKDADDVSAITDFENGVFGNEAKFAKALKARDSNRDIMFTSMYYKQGDDPENFMGGKVDKGLKYIENEEKNRLADAIEYRTGKKINTDEILSQYESDGTNDMNARKIYTINVDGTDYDFRFTSPDGKHVVMQEKKTGTKEWHDSMQKKENAKYDVDAGIKDWKKADKTQKPPISVQKPSASGGGEMTAEEWANMGDSFKINIIKRWIKEDPQKAREWINSISSK